MTIVGWRHLFCREHSLLIFSSSCACEDCKDRSCGCESERSSSSSSEWRWGRRRWRAHILTFPLQWSCLVSLPPWWRRLSFWAHMASLRPSSFSSSGSSQVWFPGLHSSFSSSSSLSLHMSVFARLLHMRIFLVVSCRFLKMVCGYKQFINWHIGCGSGTVVLDCGWHSFCAHFEQILWCFRGKWHWQQHVRFFCIRPGFKLSSRVLGLSGYCMRIRVQ